MLKDPAARPIRTDAEVEYLGYRVRRGHVRAGTKARDRLPGRLREAATHGGPAAVEATIAAYGAVWKFGP